MVTSCPASEWAFRPPSLHSRDPGRHRDRWELDTDRCTSRSLVGESAQLPLAAVALSALASRQLGVVMDRGVSPQRARMPR